MAYPKANVRNTFKSNSDKSYSTFVLIFGASFEDLPLFVTQILINEI